MAHRFTLPKINIDPQKKCLGNYFHIGARPWKAGQKSVANNHGRCCCSWVYWLQAFPNFHSNSSDELRNCPSRMLFPGNEFVKTTCFLHRKNTTFEDWTPSYQCLLNKKQILPTERRSKTTKGPKTIQLTNLGAEVQICTKGFISHFTVFIGTFKANTHTNHPNLRMSSRWMDACWSRRMAMKYRCSPPKKSHYIF